MPTPKTPARRRLDELLADGEWHDREQLILDTVGIIPPGIAARHARDCRTRARAVDANRAARDGRIPRAPSGGRGPADDTRVGARSIATRTLRRALDRHAYEARTHRGVAQIRLRTGGE